MAPAAPDDPDLKAAIERACAGLEAVLARISALDVQAELERVSRRLTVAELERTRRFVIERDPGPWTRWWPAVVIVSSMAVGGGAFAGGMLVASNASDREVWALALLSSSVFLLCLPLLSRR